MRSTPDQRRCGVLLSNPTPFSVEERRAIDRLYPVRRRNGHDLVLTPGRLGSRTELLSPTTEVVSLTPFAPSRHWKRRRDGDYDAWLVEQVALECTQRGLPKPIEATLLRAPVSTQRKARWLDFVRSRKGDAPKPAFGLGAGSARRATGGRMRAHDRRCARRSRCGRFAPVAWVLERTCQDG